MGNAAATENAWGVGFDDWGQAFYDPGNQNNAVYLDPALSPVPERFITKSAILRRSAPGDLEGQGDGDRVLRLRHLPDDLQGLMAKSIYMASYVDLHQLIDERSGFRSEPRGELLGVVLADVPPLANDGRAGRGHLFVRLVQSDHRPLSGELSRSAARSHARPHLAADG